MADDDFDDFDADLDFDNLDLGAGTDNGGDDDEDLAEIEQLKLSKENEKIALTPAEKERINQEAERALQKKINDQDLANETPAERKAREKREIEAGKVASVGDMFDGMDNNGNSRRNNNDTHNVSFYH